MVVVPVEAPLVTTPVDELTEAANVLVLLHVPPPTVLLIVVTELIHSSDTPLMAAGVALVVNVAEPTEPQGDV